MNIKFAKRFLAVTVAASMLIVPMTVGATDSSSSGSETTVSADEANTVKTTSVASAGGQVVKNELPGAFLITTSSPVSGVAIKATAAEIRQEAGLASNETPFAKVYTVDRAKSPAVYASFDAAASTVGGTTLGGLNVDLVALTGGKVKELSAGVSVPVTMAIKNYNPNLTYYVVKVVAGGDFEMIPVEVDANGLMTFSVSGGLAGYGLIAK